MGMFENLFRTITNQRSVDVNEQEAPIRTMRLGDLPGLIEVDYGEYEVSTEELAKFLGLSQEQSSEILKEMAKIWNKEMLLSPETFAVVAPTLQTILTSPEEWLAASQFLLKKLHVGESEKRVYGNGSLQFLTDTVPGIIAGGSAKNLEELKATVDAVISAINPHRRGEQLYKSAGEALRARTWSVEEIGESLAAQCLLGLRH